MNKLLGGLCLLFSGLVCQSADANQFIVNGGGGEQPNANQSNRSYGADLVLWRKSRSHRQELFIGVGYTYLGTDTLDHDTVRVWTVFPQLNLYAPERNGVLPYFFVRALSPSYLSSTQYGEREQAKQFAFQAQIGAGLQFGANKQWLVSLSYKHFSNANLFQPNDGFDIPVLLNIGVQW